MFRLLVQRLLDHLKELDRQVDELEKQIVKWHRQNDDSSKLAEVPGIGPITASALVASIGDAKSFDNGRQVAAWLGLVPKQHSSGGKQNLLGISKRGDTYLRTMLIHGARSVVSRAEKNPTAAVGSMGSSVAAIKTWPRLHWQTRTPGLRGHCWPMTGSSDLITRAPRWVHRADRIKTVKQR